MATAASLNATATIVNGYGLSANPALSQEITTFRSHQAIKLVSNIFNNAVYQSDSNIANVVCSAVNSLGNTAQYAQFLIDFYPPSASRVVSSPGSIVTYGNVVTYTLSNAGTPLDPTDDYLVPHYSPESTTASFSSSIQTQSQLPFAYGMAGFANVFSIIQGHMSSVLDTVGSISMLTGKTYGQSGLAYKGVTDLVTGGIGTEAPLLGNTVAGWGTMYNITNINLISDPYVFGQNLLDHNLGSYGNLADQLTATGLDINDITQIPASTTSITQEASTVITTSSVGAVELPTVANVVVTNTVTGNSPNVITAIYKTITGANLQAIVSATQFITSSTNTQLKTLADYLDFTKVVDPALLPALNKLGIYNFIDFSKYLNSRVGQATFKTWKELADFLLTIHVPKFSSTTTTADTAVISPSTISTLSALTGSGTGPFNNPVILDYLGATDGTGYVQAFQTLNTNFDSLATTVYPKLVSLDKSVTDFNRDYALWVAANTGGPAPDTSTITSNVVAVNNALNALSSLSTLQVCQTAYISMLTKLSTEVTNLSSSGATFGSADSSRLLGFGQQIGSLGATDRTASGIDKFIANLITNDANGDTIRAVIAETDNLAILAKVGVSTNNDPNPRLVISKAQDQNVPLSTYISQNK
ncbi:hypothetical protein UFOVP112_283 [uncultured Caudovirales phage]|uniref:Uncharacterized protein n=1 Tax=uncultured Caudovirales phage TaxID=2100421 RepID=A0A6J5L5J5_9CAUD|nr:hypothetical protein UFOVP112_283 [uncultured Caudovirales phage]